MGSSNTSKRILIILMGSLGDVARGLALVPLLKAARPDYTVHWLIEPKWQALVAAQPAIDRIIVFDRPRGLRAILPLMRQLRAVEYDIVLDLQRHFKSGFFSRLTGAPIRIGFARSDGKEFNWLFQTRFIPPAGESVPKITHYLMFLRALGLEVPHDISSPYLVATDSTERALPQGPYVVLVLGSSWPSKDWPVTGYARVIELLLQEMAVTLVLVGDQSQKERAARLSELYPTNRLHNLAGCTSLTELMLVLKGATVCVGPDSGPGHIAAGFGVPTVTIFGPTAARRTAPLGKSVRILESNLGCAPCYRRVCPGLDTLCMRSHDPRTVAHTVQDILREVGVA